VGPEVIREPKATAAKAEPEEREELRESRPVKQSQKRSTSTSASIRKSSEAVQVTKGSPVLKELPAKVYQVDQVL
jgi:hypothetical protein